MKKQSIFFITFFIISVVISGQGDCKVLMKGIDLRYAGQCKKGLANGEGEAWGVADHYTGRFRKGLPHGKGTYEYAGDAVYTGLWLNGMRHGEGTLRFRLNGKDTLQAGIWDMDKYTGKKSLTAGYRIVEMRSIDRVKVYRQGEGNEVRYYFRVVSGNPEVSNEQYSGSSGSEADWSGQHGFRHCEFPFTTEVRFQMWNKFMTARYEVVVKVEITEPGTWIIELNL